MRNTDLPSSITILGLALAKKLRKNRESFLSLNNLISFVNICKSEANFKKSE